MYYPNTPALWCSLLEVQLERLSAIRFPTCAALQCMHTYCMHAKLDSHMPELDTEIIVLQCMQHAIDVVW